MDEEIAVVHDQLSTIGGAAEAAFILARTFDCPLFAMEVDQAKVPDDVDVRKIGPDGFRRRLLSGGHFYNKLYRVLQWQDPSELYEFDTLILNKLEPRYFIPEDRQTVVWNVHSPASGRYDLFHYESPRTPRKLLKSGWRTFFETNTVTPDAMVANSDLVKHRLRKYWGVSEDDVTVIYEPVDTGQFGPEKAGPLNDEEPFYLSISRLSKLKQIGPVVEAFNELDQRLVVAGDGPERSRLESMAGDNVEFVGYISGEEKAAYMAEAKAMIANAINEDFGMTPIESLASGTPVIGVNDGFTQYQIIDGVNGVQFDRGVENLRSAVESFEGNGVKWTESELREFAQNFDVDRYQRQFQSIVKEARNRTAINVPWSGSDPTFEQK
ncbi:group 1 glycosyl transferase [Haloterrigena salina JCM 13891]|uniref:Group 1 glycosyl transferase n=1 Tax=Haloterrigena salina JCM 13891 TaxID=1227488 RepID=M0C950_9EURY|nr:glycosyltransferase [Haloterrigena salina]ELZ19143.1 group 1 glycosyl transferase [Haloterrigena salina JCM 13891]